MTNDGFFNGSLTIDQLVKEAHLTAIDKGWWIYPRTALEIHALIHSEVAEATEAARSGKVNLQLEELADVIIRIADYCGYRQWDLSQALEVKMAHNKTRAFRHGGKLA
jgi:NTP pyrophosphatase (non-canonical NTP hydrolase)